MMHKFIIAAVTIAALAVATRFLFPPPTTFAFDKTFPADGTTWQFTVVIDEDSTALTGIPDRFCPLAISHKFYN